MGQYTAAARLGNTDCLTVSHHNSQPIRARDKFQWPGTIKFRFKSRMNLLYFVSLAFSLFTLSMAGSLRRVRRGDGYNDVGGVYNSPEAQDYWAARFGFLAGLQLSQEEPHIPLTNSEP